MTIYVTGSAGFIGSHFIALVPNRDVEVVPLDLALSGQTNGSIIRVLEHAGEDDLVVLLGANPEVAQYARNPGGDVAENIEPIVRQMHAARRAKLIILASSFGGLFGEPNMTRLGRPAATDDQPWPVSPYFAGKMALEAYLHAQHKVDGTSYRFARFANVYGHRGKDQLSEWRGVIPDWIQRRVRFQPFDVWGDLEATRDYIHVADVVDALWRLWQKADNAKGDTVHIGTGTLTSLKELGMAIATTQPLEDGEEVAPPEPAFTFEEARPGYIVEGSRVNLEEAQGTLSLRGLSDNTWEPMSLAQGLQRTWQHFLMEGRE